MLTRQVLDFLSQLRKNNNREWFAEHKAAFQVQDLAAKDFFKEIQEGLQQQDSIEKMQIFRIYRDIRFSKDKTPYKDYLSAWFTRTKPFLRGSYYLHISPGDSFIEGGFWEPDKDDLLRIRRELELDASELTAIEGDPEFKKYFGKIEGEELKTAPKDFDRNHPAIGYIRKKQFLMIRRFTDDEVLNKNFKEEVLKTYHAMRPFFDYMSDVLTTNLNGESLIK